MHVLPLKKPTRGWIAGALFAALALMAGPAVGAFDADFTVNKEALEHMTVEKPTEARDFVNHIAIYLRIIPAKGNRVFPVFIDTHNYLKCPDSDERWILNRVAQVAHDRRRGVKVLGFFFDKPSCDRPHYHMEAVIADS